MDLIMIRSHTRNYWTSLLGDLISGCTLRMRDVPRSRSRRETVPESMSLPSRTTKTQRGVQPVAGCMPTNRRRSWRASIIGACAVVLSGAIGVKEATAQCQYEIVAEMKNPTCEGGLGIGTAAISDTGIVVGNFSINCGFDVQPYMWTEEGGFIALPLPPGVSEARAEDVNNHGEIVGFLTRPDLGKQIAFHWDNGEWTELPSLDGYPILRAHAISDNGIIVGEAFDPNAGGHPFRAVMWIDGVITELQLPHGPNAYALDVNELSFAAGLMGDGLFGNKGSFGFLHDTHVTIEIPPLRRSNSAEAVAVNDHNVATGQSIIPVKDGSYPRRSWIFENGMLSDLGVLPEADHRTNAEDINDARQVVGRSTPESGSSKPFLWQHGQMFDLESLIINPPAGLNIGSANAINNAGWIVAGAFVLRPVGRTLGDVNIDCAVDERDLVDVLQDWGPDKINHPTDQVSSATFQPPGDGVVDAADLAVVLANWSASGSQFLSTGR